MNAPLEPALAAFLTPRARRRALTSAGSRVLVELNLRHERMRRYVQNTLGSRGQFHLLAPATQILENHARSVQRELYSLFTSALEDVINNAKNEN